MSRGRSSLGGGSRGGGFSRGGGSRSHGGIHFGGGLNWIIPAMLLSKSTNSGGQNDNNNNEPVYKYKKVRNKKATAITAIILAVACALCIALSVCFRFDAVYTQTTAVVTGCVEEYDYDDMCYYLYTSYKFEVDGQIYKVQSKSGWTQLPDGIKFKDWQTEYYGKEYQIYYKNSDPYQIWEIEAKEYIPDNSSIYVTFAVILGIICIIICAVGINKYELDSELMEQQAEIKSKILPDGKVKCSYCGTIVDKETNKCPSCGASVR